MSNRLTDAILLLYPRRVRDAHGPEIVALIDDLIAHEGRSPAALCMRLAVDGLVQRMASIATVWTVVAVLAATTFGGLALSDFAAASAFQGTPRRRAHRRTGRAHAPDCAPPAPLGPHLTASPHLTPAPDASGAPEHCTWRRRQEEIARYLTIWYHTVYDHEFRPHGRCPRPTPTGSRVRCGSSPASRCSAPSCRSSTRRSSTSRSRRSARICIRPWPTSSGSSPATCSRSPR